MAKEKTVEPESIAPKGTVKFAPLEMHYTKNDPAPDDIIIHLRNSIYRMELFIEGVESGKKDATESRNERLNIFKEKIKEKKKLLAFYEFVLLI